MTHSSYAVVLLVTPPGDKDIERIVAAFAKSRISRSATYCPVHVTLLYEVRGALPKVTRVIRAAIERANAPPLRLRTRGVGSFRSDRWATNPYAILIRLYPNADLRALRAAIAREVTRAGLSFRRLPRFVPHITLAHDDLSLSKFRRGKHLARALYKDCGFQVSCVSVLRQGTNDRWIEVASIPLRELE